MEIPRRSINHIALLVPSAAKASEVAKKAGWNVAPTEDWDGEGTREVYVGGEVDSARLLLMEPIKEGAYTRAMQKRGPGLHHIAIDVLDLEAFILSLSSTGWLLHPKSLHTIKKSQTAYLARPGFPMLVEVQQKKELYDDPPFITRLGISLDETGQQLLKALSVDQIVANPGEPWIEALGVKAPLKDFF